MQAKVRVDHSLEAFWLTINDAGCALCADGYTDAASRPLLNNLIVTSKGALFFSAVDSTGKAKTAPYICEQLSLVIERIGVANVVCVITDSAANCKAAGALIELVYPGITWMPCTAHCLDLALEDIGGLVWASDTAILGRQLCKFVRNHQSTQAQFRKVDKRFNLQLELISPGGYI